MSNFTNLIKQLRLEFCIVNKYTFIISIQINMDSLCSCNGRIRSLNNFLKLSNLLWQQSNICVGGLNQLVRSL